MLGVVWVWWHSPTNSQSAGLRRREQRRKESNKGRKEGRNDDNKEQRKQRKKDGRTKGRKDERTEGRKDGRKQRSNEGRKEQRKKEERSQHSNDFVSHTVDTRVDTHVRAVVWLFGCCDGRTDDTWQPAACRLRASVPARCTFVETAVIIIFRTCGCCRVVASSRRRNCRGVVSWCCAVTMSSVECRVSSLGREVVVVVVVVEEQGGRGRSGGR